MMKFIIPDFTRYTWLVLDPFLAGIVLGKRSRACWDTSLTDFCHGIYWFFVSLEFPPKKKRRSKSKATVTVRDNNIFVKNKGKQREFGKQ